MAHVTAADRGRDKSAGPRNLLFGSSSISSHCASQPDMRGWRTAPGNIVMGTHGLVNEPGIKVHVGIELALHEVVVLERNALAFQSNLEQRILAIRSKTS